MPSTAVPSTAMPSTAVPFTAVLRSELLKIRSVRSLGVTLAALLASTAAFSALLCATTGSEEAGRAGFDPLQMSFSGLNIGQIAAICFGANAMAGEFRGSGLRVSLAAVPQRGRFYAAKLTAVGALALAVGLVTSSVSFFAGQSALGPEGLTLGDPGALRAVLGCALYLALLCVFSAGLTALLGSGPAAMGLLIPFVLLVSFIIGDVTQGGTVTEFLPDRSGQQVLLQQPSGTLGPWTGMAVMTAWTALAAAAGRWSLHRRDA